MADYKKMYSVLFNAISDAIFLLQEAQKQTENLYISSSEVGFSVLEAKRLGDAEMEKREGRL